MKTTDTNINPESIKTLEDFAELINASDDFLPVFTEIINKNGWADLCGEDEWLICSDGEYRLEYDCNGVAVTVPLPVPTAYEKKEIRKRIGKQIAELRKAKGYSQTDLAEKTGYLQPAIARIENGLTSVGLDVLSNIAFVLGASVELVKKQ